MKRHFYENKKICPALSNNIDLTEEIKQHILLNRIYLEPVQQEQQQIINVTNQTINNYYMINNFIKNINFIDDGQSHVTVDYLEDKVYEEHCKPLKQLEYCSDSKQIITKLMNSLHCIKNSSDVNISYNERLQELNLFGSEELRYVLMDAAIKELVERMQVLYFHEYECFLISGCENYVYSYEYKIELKEHLERYLKFLSVFRITPYLYDGINNDTNQKWCKLYIIILGNTSLMDIRKIKQEVYDSSDIHETIMNIINIQEDFSLSTFNC